MYSKSRRFLVLRYLTFPIPIPIRNSQICIPNPQCSPYSHPTPRPSHSHVIILEILGGFALNDSQVYIVVSPRLLSLPFLDHSVSSPPPPPLPPHSPPSLPPSCPLEPDLRFESRVQDSIALPVYINVYVYIGIFLYGYLHVNMKH